MNNYEKVIVNLSSIDAIYTNDDKLIIVFANGQKMAIWPNDKSNAHELLHDIKVNGFSGYVGIDCEKVIY
jgi:hypothetical protein